MSIKTKIGIANAHGLESYIEGNEKLGYFVPRARFNRERHAVAYKIKVSEATDKKILNAIKDKKFILALKILKSKAIKIELSNNGSGNVQASWEQIPNHKIDPYY